MRPKGLHELKVLLPDSCFPLIRSQTKNIDPRAIIFFSPVPALDGFSALLSSLSAVLRRQRWWWWRVMACQGVCDMFSSAPASKCALVRVHPIPNFFPHLFPPNPLLALRCLTEVCVPRSFAGSLRLFIGIFSHSVPTLGAMRRSRWAFAGATPSRALGMGWEQSREVGGGLAWRLALLRRSDPGTAAEAGPAPPAPTWP